MLNKKEVKLLFVNKKKVKSQESKHCEVVLNFKFWLLE